MKLNSISLFHFKERKKLRAQIEDLTAEIKPIEERIHKEKAEQHRKVEQLIAPIQEEMKPILDKIEVLKKKQESITVELSKDR